MDYTFHTVAFCGRQKTFSLLVPHQDSLRKAYEKSQATGAPMLFPYWGKIWPAAYALAKYLDDDPSLVQNKEVLELAAGLGLPALIASQYATRVTASDYQEDAVEVIQKNIVLNGIGNMNAELVDWQQLPKPFKYDVILLSDINYEPAVFDKLYTLVTRMINEGVSVILATPQRLLAKPFIERLLPLCKRHDVAIAEGESISVITL